MLESLHDRQLELLKLRHRAARLSTAARAREQQMAWWLFFNRP